MELDPPALFPFNSEGGVGDVAGGSHAPVVGGHGHNGVAVRHPYLGMLRDALEEGTPFGDESQAGPAIFAAVAGSHLPAVLVDKKLRSVTNPQQGNLPFDTGQVGSRSPVITH